MGNQKRQECVDLAVSQIGYKEGKDNENKYAKYFDTPKKDGGAWQFFNTKKQHADWCSIFVHWVLCHVLGIEETRKALGEPSAKNNCGAGVKYLYNYMKAKGLIIDVKDAQPADIIFLNTVKTCSHVGMVEYADSKIHSVEGNKSNKVGRGTYSKNSKSIYAVGRIDWSKFPDEVKPEPKPEPTPAPAPAPKPAPKPAPANKKKLQPAKSYAKSYVGTWKVNTNGDTLNMRYGAGKEYGIITSIPKGKHVTCYGYYTKEDGTDWLCVVYGNHTGYCSKAYLVKI